MGLAIAFIFVLSAFTSQEMQYKENLLFNNHIKIMIFISKSAPFPEIVLPQMQTLPLIFKLYPLF